MSIVKVTLVVSPTSNVIETANQLTVSHAKHNCVQSRHGFTLNGRHVRNHVELVNRLVKDDVRRNLED